MTSRDCRRYAPRRHRRGQRNRMVESIRSNRATNASSMLLRFIRAQAITVVPPTSTRRRGRQGRRLASHAVAWRGEVNRSRRVWASSGRANSSVIFGVPGGVGSRGPADWVGGCPPAPRWLGGGVRPVGAASQPEPDRAGQDPPLHDPARKVQRNNGVGARVHHHLGVVRRTVEHPPGTGGIDCPRDLDGELGVLVVAERVAFDVSGPQPHRERAGEGGLAAAGAADQDDPLGDRLGGCRTRRHIREGTARVVVVPPGSCAEVAPRGSKGSCLVGALRRGDVGG
jgi:hypothetical protein